MEIQQPGSGIDSWLAAARSMVLRAKSMKNEPQKWCFASSIYEANISGMLNNTSVEYLDPVDCEGTLLPPSFDLQNILPNTTRSLESTCRQRNPRDTFSISKQ